MHHGEHQRTHQPGEILAAGDSVVCVEPDRHELIMSVIPGD
jgi:hypothetical protein